MKLNTSISPIFIFIISINYTKADQALSQCLLNELDMNTSSGAYQLVINTMANIVNTSYSLCCNDPNCVEIFTVSTGIYKCYPSFGVAVCIGNLNQQHACSASNDQGQICTEIDWSISSKNCSEPLIYYMSFQNPSTNVACCTGSSCLPPISKNNWSCLGGDETWLCVNSGYGIECANAATGDICSGNFTLPNNQTTVSTITSSMTPLVTISQTTRIVTETRTNSNTFVPSETSIVSSSSSLNVPAIVGGSVSALVVLVLFLCFILWINYKKKEKISKKEIKYKPEPVTMENIPTAFPTVVSIPTYQNVDDPVTQRVSPTKQEPIIYWKCCGCLIGNNKENKVPSDIRRCPKCKHKMCDQCEMIL